MGEYQTAKKAADETMKLQKARRDFEQLKEDEKKYLKEREDRTNEKLEGLNKQIETSTSLLGNIADKVERAIGDYKKKFLFFVNNLDFLFKRSDTIIESAQALKDKAEKLHNIILEKYAKLQDFEKSLGEWDTNLVKREEAVNKLNKEADEKLAEAMELADWANSGKRYTIKPKK